MCRRRLVAGLDDCTEMVRFAAAETLYEAAGHPCQTCKSSSCCGPKVREKLTQIAYETKENGCYYVAVRTSAARRATGAGRLRRRLSRCRSRISRKKHQFRCVLRRAWGRSGVCRKAARPTPAVAATELTGAGTAGSAVTRKGIMAASQLRGDKPSDVFTAGARPEIANDDQGRVVATAERRGDLRAGAGSGAATAVAGVSGRAVDRCAATGLSQRAVVGDRCSAAAARGRQRQSSRLAAAGYAGPGTQSHSPADDAAAQAYLEQAGRRSVQVTPDAVLDWYRRNIEQFRKPAAVRWEQVVVPFDKVAGRDEADAVIHRLRQRWLGGRLPPVEEQALDTIRVELVDWTEVTTISPPQIQTILNQLSVGELSPIFEDASGFRMVRVLERRGESIRPLTEVSSKIEGELRRERQQAAENQYLQELRERAEIWTIIPLAEIGQGAGEVASTAGAAADVSQPPAATLDTPPESPAPKAIMRTAGSTPAAEDGVTDSEAGSGSGDRAKPLLRTSDQR